jgi:hypothetical protein
MGNCTLLSDEKARKVERNLSRVCLRALRI